MDEKFADMTSPMERDGQWLIRSPYWEVPMVDEKSAKRVCEILECAERFGQEQALNRVRSALRLPEIGG